MVQLFMSTNLLLLSSTTGLMGCGGVHAISSTLPGHCSQGEGGIGQGCASSCSPGPALCVFTGLASELEVFAEG